MMFRNVGILFCCLASVLTSLLSPNIGLCQTNATQVSQTKQKTDAADAPVQPANGANSVQHQLENAGLTELIQSIEPYHKQKEITGTAVLSGSTTMLALGKSWSDRFRKFHPQVTFTRGPDGTEAGLESLSEDSSVIAGCSRPLLDSDLATLKNGKCKDPLAVIVALDPLALYVNKNNPIVGIAPEQLESIFRAPGGKGKHVSNWGEIGVIGDLASKPIRIHARSEISGTTTFIKQMILQGGDMAKESKSHKSSEEVCAAIGADAQGVGICGFGEASDQVRAVPLILNGQRIPATEQSFLCGQYPFVRPLILVIDKSQMASDGGLREGILRYILSRDGQMEAIREGFFPMDPAFIRQQLDLICGPQLR